MSKRPNQSGRFRSDQVWVRIYDFQPIGLAKTICYRQISSHVRLQPIVALGMKGEMYEVFWTPASPGPVTVPIDLNNPVSVTEQKYQDAANAIEQFAANGDCDADETALKAAELRMQYAQREFDAGKPAEALEKLKSAADALDMKRRADEIYNLFWPSKW